MGTRYLLQPHSDGGVQGDGGGGQALLKQHQKSLGQRAFVSQTSGCLLQGKQITRHLAESLVPFRGGSKAFIALSESCL